MNDSGGIRFDTTNVRGFAEYMHHLLTTKYSARSEKIAIMLNGGAASETDGRAHSDGQGSMGTSGVGYYGHDVGKAEAENAQAGSIALAQIVEAWRSMANGAAYAAEEYSGQDGDNADELGKDFTSGDKA